MSEAAIENEDQFVIESDDDVTEEVTEVAEETQEVETASSSADDEEIEIAVDGEEEPTSKPVRKNGFAKRIGRATRQRDEARDEAEQERQRRIALEQELALLRNTKTVKAPDPEDFDTTAEYFAEKARYDEERIATLAAEQAQKQAQRILEQNQSQTTQSEQIRQFEAQSKAHDARAAALKVKDYDEVEDEAINVLGDDLSRTIVNTVSNSEVLMYYLGKNLDKAEELRRLTQSDPVKCVLEMGRLAGTLQVRPKNKPAPNPETTVEGGMGTKVEGEHIQGARFE